MPSATTIYELDVRCSSDHDCVSSDSLQVTVVSRPVAEAGPDAHVCEGESVVLDGSGSSAASFPGVLEYRWREGAAVIRVWSADPRVLVTPPATAAFELVVRCSSLIDCASLDAMTVIVGAFPEARAGDDELFCNEDYIDLDAGTRQRALDAGISELNGRESLMWSNIKISATGWKDDATTFGAVDTDLGIEYIWTAGPDVTGGTIKFGPSGAQVSLNRSESTDSSPGFWNR